MEKSNRTILLYIPNLIGYLRLGLLVLSACTGFPRYCVFIYSLSASLDLFDGIAARKFSQTSTFGAWLDVIIDNTSRSFIWTNVSQFGWIVSSIEWIVFVGNHQESGVKWRDMKFKNEEEKKSSIVPPNYVLKVMENGFKTPLGTLTIMGLHTLPICIYVIQNHIIPMDSIYDKMIIYSVLSLLIIGRLICLSCELWCIQRHIKTLLDSDQNQNMQKIQ